MNDVGMSPQSYRQQLAQKIERISVELNDFMLPQLEVFESSISHFRLRAEFRVWHDGDDLYYVML